MGGVEEGRDEREVLVVVASDPEANGYLNLPVHLSAARGLNHHMANLAWAVRPTPNGPSWEPGSNSSRESTRQPHPPCLASSRPICDVADVPVHLDKRDRIADKPLPSPSSLGQIRYASRFHQ
jgi:hypothetical protein